MATDLGNRLCLACKTPLLLSERDYCAKCSEIYSPAVLQRQAYFDAHPWSDPLYRHPIYRVAKRRYPAVIDLAMQYDAVQAKLVMRVMLAGWQRGESFLAPKSGDAVPFREGEGLDALELSAAVDALRDALWEVLAESWCAGLSRSEALSLCAALGSEAQITFHRTKLKLSAQDILRCWNKTHYPELLGAG